MNAFKDRIHCTMIAKSSVRRPILTFATIAGYLACFSMPSIARAQDTSAAEMQYSIQCSSPSDAMMAQMCSMLRQQIDAAHQQQLDRAQDAQARSAVEALQEQERENSALVAASAAQMSADLQAQRQARARSESPGSNPPNCHIDQNWCHAPPGGACNAEKTPRC